MNRPHNYRGTFNGMARCTAMFGEIRTLRAYRDHQVRVEGVVPSSGPAPKSTLEDERALPT